MIEEDIDISEELDDNEYFANYYDYQEPEMKLGDNWEVYEEQRKRPALLVSACLLGAACRYDGKDNLKEEVRSLAEHFRLVAVCPEVLGGLAVPRNPSERQGERVVNNIGEDVTEAYQKGALEAWEYYQNFLCDAAVLKARSPSCGAGEIYDGSFTHTKIKRDGVAAELLKQKGVAVFTDEELPLLRKYFQSGAGALRIAQLKEGKVSDMNQSELEQKFEKEMLANIAQAESLGCQQKKLKQSIERYGAAAAMENLIRRRQLSEGYACLEKLGRLDLSAEALTVKSTYGELFSDQEVNICFDVLCESKFYK